MSNTRDARNHEIQLVWKYLRQERKHTAEWTRSFMQRNYFLGQDMIYRVLQEDFKNEHFDKANASLIYQAVFTNLYFDEQLF